MQTASYDIYLKEYPCNWLSEIYQKDLELSGNICILFTEKHAGLWKDQKLFSNLNSI